MTVLLNAPNIFGHAMFSDDVRLEADGKITYVGVYAGTMFVRGAFPFVLPKFVISAFFSQKKDIFDPNLELLVFMPGDAEEKASIQVAISGSTTGAAEQAAKDMGLADPELPVIQLQNYVMIAPFTVNEPGLIRVRILRRSELHRLGSLRVIPAPPPLTP